MFHYSTSQSRLVLWGLMPNILPQCTAEIVTEGLSVARKNSAKEQQQRKVFIRSAINCWHQVKRWTFRVQVGWGGSGQRCHGDFVSTSTRWSAGNPALHQRAEGQDPHLEEGEGPAKRLQWPRLTWLMFWLTHWFLIDRKFMTHRTAAGRRTPSVRGQHTVSVIQTRHPQTNCEHEINGRWCCVSMCFGFCDSGNHPSFYRVQM